MLGKYNVKQKKKVYYWISLMLIQNIMLYTGNLLKRLQRERKKSHSFI